MESIGPAVKGLLLVLVTPVLLLGFHYRQSLTTVWRMALVGLMGITILAFGLRDVQIMRSHIAHPPKWDFLLFWMYGRVAAQGLNFYEPEHASKLVEQYQFSFYEPFQVHFFYPPQTMFLFLPLGWFEPQTAHLLWYLFLSSILALDIFLLWKTFLKESGWEGLMLTGALVLTLKATSMTIYFGQTSFILLLMLLLFWRERERLRGGMWLAMGICTKPLFAILPMVLVLQRNWRALISTLITLGVISGLAILTFGPKTVFSYFTASPTAHAPASMYTEQMNQSLLATVLRLTGSDVHSASPLFHPVFVGLSLVLTALTGWLVFRLGPHHFEWALCLTLALLVYPGTLEHYSLLLIAPMLLLWACRQDFIGGVWGAVGFITLEYALISNSYTFFANALAWVALAGGSAWMLRRWEIIQPNYST